MIGKTLAHYEVTDLIGKGGMGEVYRARDTKLDREVALKVLPNDLASDTERIARFQREARTLATLQHPNVASVYGFEETPEARFLVMELVEGEDLQERLQRGPIPIDEAVAIARQLTEGLEAAHERNIVHRDLKPANIRIDPEGQVKILDFGLARAFVGDTQDPEDLAHSPTITAAMTQAGTILGTAAYMSPEQAKGRTVDKRADIWAYGAILYEMLCGHRLFEAETVSETIAGVLLTEIDWDALPEDTPESLRILVERCLQKDPKLRLRDVGEARIVLADPEASIALRAASIGAVPSSAGGRSSWRWAPVALLAVAAALVAGLFAGRTLAPQSSQAKLPALLFDIPNPSGSMVIGSLALSPDGQRLVFARRDSLGRQNLWIRRLDEDTARPLPGTEGGRQPFWSFDGRKIGFFIGDDLYRTGMDGSAAIQIATISHAPRGGAWNQEDLILVGTNDGPIFSVAATGGTLAPLTEVEEKVENAHCWPVFLPDGKYFAYLSDASDDEGHRLYVQSLDGSDRKILQKSIRSAIFVDYAGALLWSDNGQLFGRPFDFGRREYTGPKVLVQDEIQPIGENHECALTLSHNGLLAFQNGTNQATVARVALDGSSREQLFPPDRYRNPRLSPDGQKVAFEVQASASERLIWAQDLARGSRTLISERGEIADSPTWSADGETIYFGSSASGEWEVFRKRVYGGTAPELLRVPEEITDISVLDCSADERWLLIAGNSTHGQDLYLAALNGEEVTWTPWLATPATEQFARFSPDTDWIAFESNTSGQDEVYVAPREGGPQDRQWMISVNGGSDMAWSPDGSTLYYRDPANTLMRVNVRKDADRIAFDAPEKLFELRPPNVGYLRNVYDLAPDGKSVIAFLETREQVPAIRVRSGWRKW